MTHDMMTDCIRPLFEKQMRWWSHSIYQFVTLQVLGVRNEKAFKKRQFIASVLINYNYNNATSTEAGFLHSPYIYF